MQEEQMAQKIMSEIHRLVQKLKEGGMAVDSTAETITTVIEGTVKYTDKLTLTGTFEKVRFDTRPVEEVKAEAEAIKAEIQAKSIEKIAEYDDIIAKVAATEGTVEATKAK
jgi:hypothetical protein